MTSKDELKRLIDELPDAQTDRAKRLLVSLVRGDTDAAGWEAVVRAHEALPDDDEPETPEEAAAVAAAKADPVRHRAEDVERALGL